MVVLTVFQDQHSRVRQEVANTAFVVIFTCVVIFGFIGYVWRNAGCSTAGEGQLRQVYNAIQLFADNNDGRLPTNIISPSGKPLVSWRFTIAPYLDATKLPFRIVPNTHWQSPLYRPWTLVSQSGLCPLGSVQSQVFAVSGGNELWWGSETLDAIPNDRVLLCFVSPQSHWMSPSDIDLAEADSAATVADVFGRGIQVLCGDGSVRCLHGDTRIQDLLASKGCYTE